MLLLNRLQTGEHALPLTYSDICTLFTRANTHCQIVLFMETFAASYLELEVSTLKRHLGGGEERSRFRILLTIKPNNYPQNVIQVKDTL